MLTRLSLIALFLSSSLLAQDDSRTRVVSIDFSVVSWGPVIPALFYKKDGGISKMRVPAFEPSATAKYTGPQELKLYLEDPKKSEAQPAAKVVIPENETKITLLLYPKGQNQFDCFAIPDDPTKLPFGQSKLINITDSPLAIRYNRTDSIVLNPRESKIIPPGANSIITLEVAKQKEGKWKRVMENAFTLGTDEQTIILFSNGDYGYFHSSANDAENEIQTTLLRQARTPAATLN